MNIITTHTFPLETHSKNWENLSWSEWISLTGDNDEFKKIPNTAGVYRIRAIGYEPLIYIGQSGRNLRERLRALRKGVMALEMPFDDPHTAAPNLWVWQKEKSYVYECSAATIELTTSNRQAFEDMLLWRHRVHTGQSTLCNYGRFHSNWSKSRHRKNGTRGERLEVGMSNPNGGASASPLFLFGKETDNDWMRLDWSEFKPLTREYLSNIPSASGIYRIADLNTKSVIYIGESKDLRSRLTTHSRKKWPEASPYFSFATPDGMDAVHRRHELEADLIGAFYFRKKIAPSNQY